MAFLRETGGTHNQKRKHLEELVRFLSVFPMGDYYAAKVEGYRMRFVSPSVYDPKVGTNKNLAPEAVAAHLAETTAHAKVRIEELCVEMLRFQGWRLELED